MLGREEGLAIVRDAIGKSHADEAEALLVCSDSALTRYAANAITQNGSAGTVGLSVRVIVGNRVGKAATNRLDEGSIERVVSRAIGIAREAEEDPEVAHVVEGGRPYADIDAYDDRTAALSPQARAEAIGLACRLAGESGLAASGSCSSSASSVTLANSRGILASTRYTEAGFTVTAAAKDSSGWAMGGNRSVGKIDMKAIARTAVDKAMAGGDPKPVQPGPYTVILEPAAIADFLLFMAAGFGAKTCAEGRSFISGKIGTRVLGENVTIVDDAYHPDSMGMPFDFEGTPRKRLELIRNGVVAAVAHDSKSARKAGVTSTGHSLPQPNSQGPMPLNLTVAGGDSSLAGMIETTGRGILVTHFHYTNVIDPIRLVITGMTRDGTFLVENGKIKHPVRNMRFTQSVVEALNNVEAISAETIFESAFFGGGFIVPAMKIRSFNFTSSTDF